jgi:transcriptional regulator with GAF, ATPase, and Fis domain
LAQLRSNGQFDVFVDYLDSSLEIEAAQLLDGLPSCPKPHRCFALGRPRFLRSTAALAAEVTSGILIPPLTASALAESFQSAGAIPALPPLKEMTCGAMTLRTRTPQMVAMLDQLLRVAELDVTLLFIGESGTGKTTLAQLVHLMSPRSQERFMAVPCGALPTEIIESELFGHVRGAFTSADRSRDGRFRVVGKGTLLLDEIDTLTARDQAKLLRVIETGEYEPVGSHETLMSEARLIVGANVELSELVQRNEFRADLYYRINVMEFRLPPLRQRPWDVIPLALDFVDEFSRQYHRVIERIDTSFLDAVRT